MTKNNADLSLCGRSWEKCQQEIAAFHGFLAPGLVLGAVMVDWAQELIGPEVEADAFVETIKCLPDAVQIFTPCTYGNGWMRVLNWNKYALTLYDKHKTGLPANSSETNGWRVWLDLEKAKAFPDLYNWFMGLVPKKDLPAEVIHAATLKAGREALSAAAVWVDSNYLRQAKEKTLVCKVCGEAGAASQGETCLSCRGEGYIK